MKVEQLKYYGIPLGELVSSMSKSVMMKIGFTIIKSIFKKSGFFGFIPLMIKVNKEKKHIIKEYPDGYKQALKLGKEPANQFLTMTALFNVVAEKEGREKAYNFTRNIFQGYAKYTMPAMYDVDNLIKCEGDIFNNYKKYNMALLSANKDYHVKEIKDEPDCLTIIVDRCVSCEIANALHCPEVGMLGCDHDLAGYPVIEDKVNSEFRRLHTIAKGDDCCDFMFFKKGKCSIDASKNK